MVHVYLLFKVLNGRNARVCASGVFFHVYISIVLLRLPPSPRILLAPCSNKRLFMVDVPSLLFWREQQKRWMFNTSLYPWMFITSTHGFLKL